MEEIKKGTKIYRVPVVKLQETFRKKRFHSTATTLKLSPGSGFLEPYVSGVALVGRGL